jgi:ubiquinone/menaquinone biosynthesis C-methylase UbiE
MKNDLNYGYLCSQVYDLRVPSIEKDAYEFYKSFALESKCAILEPMCGTGRFLIPLTKEGFDIEGFDVSKYMIMRLHEKASAQKVKAFAWVYTTNQLIQGGKTYDLIFIPFSSFGLVTHKEDVLTMLKNFFQELAYGGKLVFEVDTLATKIPIKQTNFSQYALDDGKVINVRFNDFPITDSTLICKVFYELIENDKIIKTEVEDYKLKLYDIKKLTHILETIGFSEIKVHKPFSRNILPDENDTMVVLECKK